jgi:YbgC/YbaW family acyl-CoA thioester hydrolase
MFRYSRNVEFADTDLAGTVHFSNYFRFMEAAELAFLRARGLSFGMEWQGERVSMPRVAASCDFIKPVTFGDVLEISVAIQRLGRSSITYAFEFFKGADVVGRGQLTAVFCRINPPHPPQAIPIPDAMRVKLQPTGE